MLQSFKYFITLNDSYFFKICSYLGLDITFMKHDADALLWQLDRYEMQNCNELPFYKIFNKI